MLFLNFGLSQRCDGYIQAARAGQAHPHGLVPVIQADLHFGSAQSRDPLRIAAKAGEKCPPRPAPNVVASKGVSP